jgi:putative chitinase
MILTDELFKQIFPRIDPDVSPSLNATLLDYNVNTVERIAGFLAQVGHESADLTRLVENLNYSAEGLASTWPTRYRGLDKKPNPLAIKLARKPEAIANNCYANRMGNGNEASGDGWRYRGRGAFMTTGRSGYFDTGRAIGLDLINNPEQLQYPPYALEAGAWFWNRYALNQRMDKGDFKGTTQIINGGQIGALDRQARFAKLVAILKGEF